MKGTTLARVLLLFICITVLAVSASTAPYKWLMTVQNDSGSSSAPILQYYQSGAVSSAEFYDHPYPGILGSYPWGGESGHQSIKAVPQNVHIDPATGGIDTFQLVVSITNDTYETGETLWNTYGWNDHNQSSDDAQGQHAITMHNVKLCCEFADDGVYGNLDSELGNEPLVYAIGYDDLAWYCYAEDEPPYPVPGLPGGYIVPTYNIAASIAPGQTATRTISFGTHLPIMPDDPMYTMLTSGSCSDLFANRAYSLKISNYPDAISGCDTDDASPWGISGNCSSVSVFFDSPENEPCLVVTGVYTEEETGTSHFWWNDPADVDKEIMVMNLRAGSASPVTVTGVTLWCDEYVAREYIQQVRIYADMNGTFVIDEGDLLIGSGNFDPETGLAEIPVTAPDEIEPGGNGIGIVALVMDPDTPAGSEFYCDLVSVEIGSCQNILGLPIYSEWRQWASKLTIPQVKMLDLNEYFQTSPVVVVEANATCDYQLDDWSRILYLEESDRSGGIRVERGNGPMSSPMVGAVAPSSIVIRAVGYVQQTWTGETYINAEWIDEIGFGEIITPVAMPNRSVGGAELGNQAGAMHDVVDGIPGNGANNIGMLIKTWGVVTYVEPWGKGFWIEDGSGRRSGRTDDFDQYIYGIYVMGDGQWWWDYMPGSGWPLEAPAVGTKVAVTGISTTIDCYEPGTEMQVPGPCILLRSPDDLQMDDTSY